MRRSYYSDLLVSALLAMTTLPLGIMASERPIAGYRPGSNVEQHSYIDLDVAEMLEHLQGNDFAAALAVYAQGGNSGARANIEVAAWPPASSSSSSYVKGGSAIVRQGENVLGYVKSWNEPIIQVTYTSKVGFPCKEGGLKTPDVKGCFSTDFDITIDQPGGAPIIISANNSNIVQVTNTYRTVRGFSTAAEAKMKGQRFFQAYRSYYNSGSYGDDLVTKALTEPDQKSNPLFYGTAIEMRKEVAKKGAVYMNIWMYVIREMEDAINDCQAGCINCNDDPVHAWDEAVAFYVGSLGASGAEGNGGNLLYKLANKRCANYRTCGDNNEAVINSKLLVEFNKGKDLLQQGKCFETIPVKDRIVELMSVPLIQGALRYAYIVGSANNVSAASATPKAIAEGFIFAQSILPRVAVCNAEDAAIITSNQGLVPASEAMPDGFAAVRAAYERNFQCMGITCADVGGLLDASKESYYADFAPCADFSDELVAPVDDESSSIPDYAIVIIAVAIVALLIAIAAFTVVFIQKRHYQLKYQKLSKGDMALADEQ